MVYVDITGKIHKILIPKKTRNEYYVTPIVLEYTYKEKPQQRYMQVVSRHVQDQLLEMKQGDIVTARIVMKGRYDRNTDKFYNLDEVEQITLVKSN